jgi:hypothetical protein
MKRRRLMLVLSALALAVGLSNAVAVGGSAQVRDSRGEGVVLGGVAYGAPNGAGWGEERPREIFNGGDPSGLISKVHWSSWGGAVARGHGRNSIFKPHGGYYPRQVVIQLKAKRIGSCEGRRAYLRLLGREPRRPGGPLGPWRSWSGPKTICRAPY